MLIDLNATEYLFHKIFVYHLAFSYFLSTVYKQKFYQQQLKSKQDDSVYLLLYLL